MPDQIRNLLLLINTALQAEIESKQLEVER